MPVRFVVMAVAVAVAVAVVVAVVVVVAVAMMVMMVVAGLWLEFRVVVMDFHLPARQSRLKIRHQARLFTIVTVHFADTLFEGINDM